MTNPARTKLRAAYLEPEPEAVTRLAELAGLAARTLA